MGPRTPEILETERAYLLANAKELAAKYPGKHLLIKGETVYGAFETRNEGVDRGFQLFPRESFPVRSVLRPEDPEPVIVPVLALGLPVIADP